MSFNNNEGEIDPDLPAMVFAADEDIAMADDHYDEDLDESFGESTLSAHSSMFLGSSFSSESSEHAGGLAFEVFHDHTYALVMDPQYMDYSTENEEDEDIVNLDEPSQGSADKAISFDNSQDSAYNKFFDSFENEEKSAAE